jgi:hypothetical protein
MRKRLKYSLIVFVLSFITLAGVVYHTAYVEFPPSITCGPATVNSKQDKETIPIHVKAGAPFRSSIAGEIPCRDMVGAAIAFGPTWGDYGRLFGTWQLYADWLVCIIVWSGITYVYISRKARLKSLPNASASGQ